MTAVGRGILLIAFTSLISPSPRSPTKRTASGFKSIKSLSSSMDHEP